MISSASTILDKIEYWSERTPNKICLIEAATDTQVTYAAFWHKILSFAANVSHGKRYVLRARQTIEHLAAFYGVQVGGGIAIPVEGTASDGRMSEIATEFEARILSTDYDFSAAPLDFISPNPENIACVILSTGTTGKSKGVMSSFRSRFCGADNVRYAYDITIDDVALVPQMLSHSGGLRRVEAMLISGATAVIMGATMLFGSVFGAIKKYSCNILQFVPAQVAQILARAETLLVEVKPQLRIVSVGSALIPEHNKERLREILPNVRLFNDFGSTEAVGSAYFEWSAYPPKASCVGSKGIHSNIVFLDDDGAVMENTSLENPGTLATEGGVIMSGYLNAPELTAEVLKNGRVISSDLGYIGEDGLIYVIGRKDDMIVSGANKISPVEIEEATMTINGVKECACVPIPDEIMGQMPALFVVWQGKAVGTEIIATKLTAELERFKVPRIEHIFAIDALPRTFGTGKVMKRKLIERWMDNENI